MSLATSIILGDVRPDFLREETLASMFRSTATLMPEKSGLVFDEVTYTYQELDRWSDAIAMFLKEQGIGAGHFVGLWWPRGVKLHVTVLGIVKSGAAYVPLDREMPAERVVVVMQEVGASACFSDLDIVLDCPIFSVPEQPLADANIVFPTGPQPDDYAYVLYTSGSTGTPKGIPITHRQICHFVRSEQSVLGVKADDKVYQGFSVSFDMWCEETWISYLVGATLYVADAIMAKSVDDLNKVLHVFGISVLHAVPSLLAVMEDTLPNVRLINAGGEACSAQVVARWATPQRQFFNSYGPTETTVTASIIQLRPGDPITIGAPLPNYNLGVVDEALRPVARGERGELIIGGAGVCNGYINRPDLTTDKFMALPVSLPAAFGDRIYRTGDAAIIHPDGSVDFQGRLDDQVKLRGYRIELGEIEVRLNSQPGVAAAAVVVKKDGREQDTLVGYVVLHPDIHFDESALRNALANLLPPYMVPAHLVQLSAMPRLPSGKIDRKVLPVPASLLEVDTDAPEEVLPTDMPLKDRVIAILHKVFPGRNINLEQDFFTDLGGHSLLAAMVVSRLRKEADIPQASLKDLYTLRPLKAVVDYWQHNDEANINSKEPFHKVPAWRFYTCFVAQTIALLAVYGLYAGQIFFPYLGYYYVQQETDHHGYALITSLALYCLIPPFFSLVSIAAKWLIIGKFKEGDYPLWGSYYFRWWLVKVMQRLTLMQFLNGTLLYNNYLRWLGIKIAPDAQLSSITFGAEDLITIEADASLSSQVVLNNVWVEDGLLKLRPIHIGKHAYIGSSAVIAGGARVNDWGELTDLSYLPGDKVIGEGEVWQGSPAQHIRTMPEHDYPQPVPVTRATRQWYRVIYALLLLIFPVVVLLPLVPVLIALSELDSSAAAYDFSYLIYTPLLAMMYLLLFGGITIVLVRGLQVNMKPGKYPVYSMFYVRKWFADQMLSLSLIVMHPIYATVYVSSFFRMLGAKVGKNTEISTASSVTHPLLQIGNGSFIADAVTLGEADVRGQQLILAETIIGDASFVGNSALIPQGYELPDDMLVGVLSTPPNEGQLNISDATTWLGSPAIALPRRQESQSFSDQLTLYPKIARKMARGIVEFIRILIPETVVFCLSVLFIAIAHDLITGNDTKFQIRFIEYIWQYVIHIPFVPRVMICLPFLYLIIIGIPAFLITVVLKWLLIFRYKPKQHPMWTWQVWKSEAITTTYEALAIPYFLEYLKGTPWLPIVLRLLGVKTGKRVWMYTADVTEFDMVSIADDTALNEDCGPQTHLFEDRVMKVGHVTIGQRCSIGARSIVLYDSEIGDDAKLDALSLVMKGEKLPENTSWIGSPVKAH